MTYLVSNWLQDCEASILKQLEELQMQLQANSEALKMDLQTQAETLQMNRQALLQHSQGGLESLRQLQSAVEGLKNENMQKLLLIAFPIIQKRLQMNSLNKTLEKLGNSQVMFAPEKTISVGHIQTRVANRKVRKLAGNGKNVPQNFTSNRLKLRWSKRDLHYGWDACVLPNGHVVVSDYGKKRDGVFMFKSNGDSVADTRSQGIPFAGPCSLTFDPITNAILVAAPSYACIKALSPKTLKLKFKLNCSGVNHPSGVAVTSEGHLVVSETGARQHVSLHETKGSCYQTWTCWDVKDRHFSQPSYLAIGPTGLIYVSDTTNQCIKVYDLSGKLQKKIGQTMKQKGDFLSPGGLTITPLGNVAVVHGVKGHHNRVSLFNREGSMIEKLIDMPLSDEYGEVRSVAIGENLLVLVTEFALLCYDIVEKFWIM